MASSAGRDNPDWVRASRLLAILAFGSLLAAGALLVLGAVYRDQLSTATSALGFAAATLWILVVAACAYASLPWAFAYQGEGIWPRLTRAFVVAAVAAVVSLVALGFAFVPGAGTGAIQPFGKGGKPPPTKLDVSWTVEEPMKVETAASPPLPSSPVLVVLRVSDPEGPECPSAYHWRVTRNDSTGQPEEVRRRDTCTADVRLLPETDYTVKVARIDPLKSPAVGEAAVRVHRLVVASFGDSVASGEGNPAPGKPHWEDLSRCNRSAIAGPRQAADRISTAAEHAFVIFFHVACTGAWIDGVGAPQAWHPNIFPLLPESQRSQVAAFASRVDLHPGQVVVLLSIGANDIGFGPILRFCLKTIIHDCYKKKLEQLPLDELVSARLAELRHSYERLASVAPFRDSRVFISEYFDPLHDEAGRICRILTISPAEAAWAERAVIRPLNALVRAEANARRWIFVSGIAGAFRLHGYCANESWIVHLKKAFLNRNPSGPFHPNALGQAEYGRRIFAAVKPYLGT